MAAVQGPPIFLAPHGGGDPEGAGGGDEEGRPWMVVEEAKEGRPHPVQLAEAAEVAGVVDEAAPALKILQLMATTFYFPSLPVICYRGHPL